MKENKIKKFKLQNYTTDIPAEKSIQEIEMLLAAFGAQAVMKEYLSDGKVNSLSFRLEDRSFKLPVNLKGVESVLYSARRRYHGRDSMKGREERAYRVAWRILKDSIHGQLSIIASGQAQPAQIFFGYMYDGKRTLYQAFTEGKLLTQETRKEEKK